jgi:hypothetical protein
MMIVTALTFSIMQIRFLAAFVIVILGQVMEAEIAKQFELFGTLLVKPINTFRIDRYDRRGTINQIRTSKIYWGNEFQYEWISAHF